MILIPFLVMVSRPDAVPATDPRIVTIGRFAVRENGLACQWSASEARVRLRGGTLKFTFSDEGQDFIQVVVDGTPKDVIKANGGPQTVSLNLITPGQHEVRLVKRTEPFVGTLTFQSFETPGGRLLPATRKNRLIEVVGDSITCGFGNEGADRSESFKAETENAYMSYGSVASRMLKADVRLIAWSGRKMFPDNTMPEIYDRVLPTFEKPLTDFGGPSPDVVVINLATNDFGKDNPEEKAWTGAYEAFLKRIWSHYPNAKVYAAIGSMMNDNWPPGHQSLTTLRGYLDRMVKRMADPRLSIIEFPVQDEKDGIGAAWHPSVATHHKMGVQLANQISKDMGWQLDAPGSL